MSSRLELLQSHLGHQNLSQRQSGQWRLWGVGSGSGLGGTLGKEPYQDERRSQTSTALGPEPSTCYCHSEYRASLPTFQELGCFLKYPQPQWGGDWSRGVPLQDGAGRGGRPPGQRADADGRAGGAPQPGAVTIAAHPLGITSPSALVIKKHLGFRGRLRLCGARPSHRGGGRVPPGPGVAPGLLPASPTVVVEARDAKAPPTRFKMAEAPPELGGRLGSSRCVLASTLAHASFLTNEQLVSP